MPIRLITRIAPDVGWLPVSFANVYFIGRPGGKWIIVDTGFPGGTREILTAAEARFGSGSRPEVIVLTHGHIDHSGNAATLADAWDAPIYAHRLETPFLNGKSAYPPADPTVGGATAFLSRFLPPLSRDLGGRLRELQTNKVPGAPGWEWLPTPGHSPGHICLFRGSDRVLLTGDALVTVNMDSWSALISRKRELARPPTPSTIDWKAARGSLRALVSLHPNVIGAGHGIPISDSDLPERLNDFVENFRPPRRGRYVCQAARTNEHGIVDLPPAPFDPVPFATAAALFCAGFVLGAGYLDEKKHR
ncbi:MAG TPA: MBL fold metallo-hydrolase [Chthoniobacterales bacterium]|jgi:glyoxylase-like metal-dependent hydrolase (beta-lactamase superfamily II)|nr:MBL fold metallo-hydrolase [Chthoniobacterales bacterium]